MTTVVRLTLLALLAWGLSAPAIALESAPVRSERLTATLLSDTDAVAPGVTLHMALRLRIAPGWHTYWQNPGEAGAPPELSWTLPPGTTAGEIAWPVPQRLAEGPVMTYAYTNEVVLPVVVTPGPGALHAEVAATWLVCERICVPEEGRFVLDLPKGAPTASKEAPLIAAALEQVPRPSPFMARVAPDGTLTLAGDGLSAATVQDAWFFPADWGAIKDAAPQPVTVGAGTVSLALRPGAAFKAAAPLSGVVVLRDPGGQSSALTIQATPGPAVVTAVAPLVQTLLFAFLGGLILNLMPCVFPVLAMKAMAVARLGGQARQAVRGQALGYTAGVLVAFGVLGGGLLAARAAGAAAGWGFQFQSPVFVAVLAAVLLTVGLNMSGVFAIGSRLAGAGQGLASQGGHGGSFFTGLLAVVVATPCTAPFMGAAIAAGLAAPAVVTMAVFGAMGLGLAAPYALLAVAPGLARWLPRPGAWMDVLKGALAFPMYAAAAWLVWVVSLQAGSAGVLATVAGLVLVAFAAWAFGVAQAAGQRGRRLGQGIAAMAVVAAVAVIAGIGPAPAAAAVASEGSEPFTALRLAALREEGRPVFVNMTAAWCVTCLVNERVALSPAPVRRAFVDRNVVYLKGDWTRGDPEITAFLRSHARDGVPLYVFYAPGQAPVILPQILTQGAMLAALDPLGR